LDDIAQILHFTVAFLWLSFRENEAQKWKPHCAAIGIDDDMSIYRQLVGKLASEYDSSSSEVFHHPHVRALDSI